MLDQRLIRENPTFVEESLSLRGKRFNISNIHELTLKQKEIDTELSIVQSESKKLSKVISQEINQSKNNNSSNKGKDKKVVSTKNNSKELKVDKEKADLKSKTLSELKDIAKSKKITRKTTTTI